MAKVGGQVLVVVPSGMVFTVVLQAVVANSPGVRNFTFALEREENNIDRSIIAQYKYLILLT